MKTAKVVIVDRSGFTDNVQFGFTTTDDLIEKIENYMDTYKYKGTVEVDSEGLAHDEIQALMDEDYVVY